MSAGPRKPASEQGPMVFITYRREETGPHAGRLYDAMVSRFGEDNVFMDVDMAPGVDFVEQITEAVAACHVLIVVMGPRWATIEDQRGRARLADPEDFVRLEVETALHRADVTPIPVLVSGAQMPNREELPQELRAITRRNAIELSDYRWRNDVGRLISTLDELLATTPGPTAPERTVASRKAAQAAAPQARVESAPPSTVAPPASAESKPAAPLARGGRWLRWALLGALAIAAILVAVLVAGGGGGGNGDEAQIAGVIETSFLSTDPADCTKLNTQRLLEQSYFMTGPDAVEACAADAQNLAIHPDSVDVSNVQVTVSGDGATAEARFQGGYYDGQTLILSLLKNGAQWKLDYINGFKNFDLDRFAAAFAATAPKFTQPLTQEQANCAAAEFRRQPPAQVEAGILSGDSGQLLPFAKRCGL